MQFHETVQGKRFFEGTLPQLVRSLEENCKLVERHNALLEQQITQAAAWQMDGACQFRDFLRYLAQTRVSSVDDIPGDTDALTLTELDAALREMRESGEAYREFVKAKATQFGPNP